ncbi:hypothetical protein DBL06_25670 [Agrobacterium pusense]|nr:hypothetical protein DBL06_25670 [Agrobacterium pusense]
MEHATLAALVTVPQRPGLLQGDETLAVRGNMDDAFEQPGSLALAAIESALITRILSSKIAFRSSSGTTMPLRLWEIEIMPESFLRPSAILSMKLFNMAFLLVMVWAAPPAALVDVC